MSSVLHCGCASQRATTTRPQNRYVCLWRALVWLMCGVAKYKFCVCVRSLTLSAAPKKVNINYNIRSPRRRYAIRIGIGYPYRYRRPPREWECRARPCGAGPSGRAARRRVTSRHVRLSRHTGVTRSRPGAGAPYVYVHRRRAASRGTGHAQARSASPSPLLAALRCIPSTLVF